MVEQQFTLAFAGHFSEAALTAAKADFAALQVPRKGVRLDRLIGQGQSGDRSGDQSGDAHSFIPSEGSNEVMNSSQFRR